MYKMSIVFEVKKKPSIRTTKSIYPCPKYNIYNASWNNGMPNWECQINISVYIYACVYRKM